MSPDDFLQLRFPRSDYNLPMLEHTQTCNDDSLTDLLDRDFVLVGFRPTYVTFNAAVKALRFGEMDAAVSEIETVERRYLEPVVEFANKFLFGGDFAASRIFFVKADNNGLWKSAVLSAEVPREANEPVDKKNICVALFVAAGNLKSTDFMTANEQVKTKVVMRRLLAELRLQCIENQCRYGFLTDGIVSVLYRHYPDYSPDLANVSVASDEAEYGPRKALAYAIWSDALHLKLSTLSGYRAPHFCQGALKNLDSSASAPVSDEELIANKRSFEDFDLYTMQRDHAALKEFRRWKRLVKSAAIEASLDTSTTLTVKPFEFFARHAVLRSPYPPIPLPRETLDIVARHPRPRCTQIDSILARMPCPTFEITKVVRSGPNHWSQVFFGRLRGSSQLICLKLFDDRFFHRPSLNGYGRSPPEHRLLTFNRATDMMRREESIYDRLAHLQGTLVPHCYGFHEFELPDGWRLWGLFTEIIDGPPLQDLPLGKYPLDVQSTLITRLRHGVRALKYAGVEQTDWHFGQILCPSDSALPPDIVFIDFAFALLWLADSGGAPVTDDCHNLYCLLRFETHLDGDTLKKLWFPEDVWEE